MHVHLKRLRALSRPGGARAHVPPDPRSRLPTRRPPAYVFNDAHFHLTNYVQEGTDIRDYVDEMMGDKSAARPSSAFRCSRCGRTATPATSRPTTTCSRMRRSTTTRSPTPASRWRTSQLTPEQRKRLDPMITGFNPADMYAVDHIRRVLETFPGVFSGIGEFSIHKEFVSSKVAGEIASLTDPALDRILDFAGEVGPRGHPAQRHRHAVPEGRPGTLLPDADEGPAAAPSEDDDHLGALRARPDRAPGAGPGDDRCGGAQPDVRASSSRRSADPR